MVLSKLHPFQLRTSLASPLVSRCSRNNYQSLSACELVVLDLVRGDRLNEDTAFVKCGLLFTRKGMIRVRKEQAHSRHKWYCFIVATLYWMPSAVGRASISPTKFRKIQRASRINGNHDDYFTRIDLLWTRCFRTPIPKSSLRCVLKLKVVFSSFCSHFHLK